MATSEFMIFFHVSMGVLALFSGTAAMIFRKGSYPHRQSGKVFAISMLAMSTSGAVIASLTDKPLSVLAGLFTFYLVATAWHGIKRKAGESGTFEIIALVGSLTLSAFYLIYGFEALNSATGSKDGVPAAVYFIFGSVATLSTLGDIRLVSHGGIVGAARIVRHLWRMSFAMFIATVSFFLGQQQIFSKAIQESNLLIAPVLIVLILMFYWFIRVQFTNWFNRRSI